MIEIGKYNELKALRSTDNGWYLWDEDGHEVLLPNKYVPEKFDSGDPLKVFVYNDSEDRIVATTLEPLIVLHQFAYLRVKEVNEYGAFLDWGLEKDLMIPYSHQIKELMAEDWCLVYLFIDELTDRLVASTKLNLFFEEENIDLKVGEEVDLLVGRYSDLGVNVIINQKYKGLIYQNELFKRVKHGEQLKGFIKFIREDNKIDVSLEKQGYISVRPNANKVIVKLENNEGFLNLNDKSDPSEIYNVLEMSKKAFKKAIGGLYKNKVIRIEADGIYLNEKEMWLL